MTAGCVAGPGCTRCVRPVLPTGVRGWIARGARVGVVVVTDHNPAAEKARPKWTRRAWWRWNVAYLLNRLPWTCWADLVSWALRPKASSSPRLYDLSGNEDDVRIKSMCRQASEDGRCYCGKVAVLRTPPAGREASDG